MKIYCIIIDTMPFCPEVLEINNMVKGDLLRQVSGCYTLTSLAQMLTGKLSTDLEPSGIGYGTWSDRLDSNGIVDWKWLETSIPFYLWKEKDFKFISRNLDILTVLFAFKKYPQFYKDSKGYNEAEQHEYIKRIQGESKGNTFHFLNYRNFHDACQRSYKFDGDALYKNQRIAGQEILGYFEKDWDFSEPDSLFWFFSDHGAWFHPHFHGYPFVQNFYTWAIVKDNLENPIDIKQKVISTQDFPLILRHKFGNVPLPEFSKDRIFLTEDGRAGIKLKEITTAIACRFKNWSGDFPLQLSYLIYHHPADNFLQRKVKFDRDGFTIDEVVDTSVVDEQLKEALISKFTWVP